jgi:catechol 2,3-dioxygenase-like lactoylglutathione lyase family enzyme
MISGAHVIVYSKNAQADRAFFRDVLGFKSVDGGHGWLIFACRREKRHSTRLMRVVYRNSILCATI